MKLIQRAAITIVKWFQNADYYSETAKDNFLHVRIPLSAEGSLRIAPFC